MKRVIRIVGVMLAIIVLIFSAWFIFEYQRIREGVYKLANSPAVEIKEYKYGFGEKDYLEIGVIRAVYLGERKNKCKDRIKNEECDVVLNFLGLDSNGNPVIFKVYGGVWNGEGDYLVKMMVATVDEGDGEGYAPVDLASDKLLELIENNSLVELHVIGGVNITSDFITDDKILLGSIDLFFDQETKIVELLARFQEVAGDEKEFISLIKGFLAYRSIVLPAYLFNIL